MISFSRFDMFKKLNEDDMNVSIEVKVQRHAQFKEKHLNPKSNTFYFPSSNLSLNIWKRQPMHQIAKEKFKVNLQEEEAEIQTLFDIPNTNELEYTIQQVSHLI